MQAHDFYNLKKIPSELQDEALDIFAHNRRAKYIWLAIGVLAASAVVLPLTTPVVTATFAILAVPVIAKISSYLSL